MTPSLVSLCLFAGWTILLVTVVALFRGATSQRSGKALNTFAPDGADVGGLGQRLTRAHLNCVENLPVVAAVILAAAVAGRADVTDSLAMPLLFARLGQSTVHLISTSVPMVMLRATLLVVQLLILASWIVRLVL
jgi:uncharacterized MAPEG superfamily protein